jgi:hypothetical protein
MECCDWLTAWTSLTMYLATVSTTMEYDDSQKFEMILQCQNKVKIFYPILFRYNLHINSFGSE